MPAPTWGFGIYESAAPNAANSIGNAFANYNQNTQGLMQMEENRRARARAEEERKKQEKKARRQFWTNLGIGTAVGLGTGAAVGAIAPAASSTTSTVANEAVQAGNQGVGGNLVPAAKSIETATTPQISGLQNPDWTVNIDPSGGAQASPTQPISIPQPVPASPPPPGPLSLGPSSRSQQGVGSQMMYSERPMPQQQIAPINKTYEFAQPMPTQQPSPQPFAGSPPLTSAEKSFMAQPQPMPAPMQPQGPSRGSNILQGALIGGGTSILSQLPGGNVPAAAMLGASPVFNPQINFNQQRLDLLNRQQALDESMFPTEQAYKQSVTTRNNAYPGIEYGKMGIAGYQAETARQNAGTNAGRLALDQQINSPENVRARLANETTNANARRLGSEASMLGAETGERRENRNWLMFPTEVERLESQTHLNNRRALSLDNPLRDQETQSRIDLNNARTTDLQGKSQMGGDQRQAVANHIAASVYPQGHPQQGMIRPESMDQVIALFHSAPSEIKHDPDLIISLMNRGIPPRRIMDKSDPQMVQIIEMLIKSKQ